jgi:hypothetical protein
VIKSHNPREPLHWRNSPLGPVLSAMLKPSDDASLDSICLPDFPAVSHVRRYSLRA